MTGFTPDWLALREPVDTRARNSQVRDAALAFLKSRSHLTLLDLGSGTGSTLRALAPQISVQQRWRLVDNDASLLARATALLGPSGVAFETTPFDFSRSIAPLLDGPTDLITASALIDLVSRQWLSDFIAAVTSRQLPVYIALSYNGVIGIDLVDPRDAVVIDGFNDHQRTDKGFGPALGPDAARVAVELFEQAGYRVSSGASDWVASGSDAAFQAMLLDGWIDTARQLKRLPPAELDDWSGKRHAEIAAGALTMRVGHLDFFARPA